VIIDMREAKRTRFWCLSCDMALVTPGAKCCVCGKVGDKSKKRGVKKNGQIDDKQQYETVY